MYRFELPYHELCQAVDVLFAKQQKLYEPKVSKPYLSARIPLTAKRKVTVLNQRFNPLKNK